MHENREISCTSWSTDQDRSAKAINRAADANVQEKSDCAVIPVNQPNKEGQPSAEGGEGRAQTQENIVQSRMRPTQSGKRMSQGLHGVRQAASERKQERFTALLHHLSVRLLHDSFYALKRQASPGVDGVTWQEYEAGLEDRLIDLHSRVHRGAYQARPSRRVYIPKADGRQTSVRHRGAGGQDCSTGCGDDSQSDLWARLQRLFLPGSGPVAAHIRRWTR
jgi:RNA-directed DNA polymerase